MKFSNFCTSEYEQKEKATDQKIAILYLRKEMCLKQIAGADFIKIQTNFLKWENSRDVFNLKRCPSDQKSMLKDVQHHQPSEKCKANPH